ncbi:unnamed protein product [Echinostoma caproni]|uniref:Uncharacterized protein n=1 Tax=Echinostoma caproni TaxID=27848 RepID=A0A183ADB9_9TREM|nr:unnamed protein product [Echinostoma caproni]
MSMKRDCLSASDILSIRKVMEHVYQRLLKLAESFTINNTPPPPTATPPTPHSMDVLGTRTTSPYANADRFGQNTQTGDARATRSCQAGSTSESTTAGGNGTPGNSDARTPPMAPLDLPPETMQADLLTVATVAASGDANPEDVIEIWCGDQSKLNHDPGALTAYVASCSRGHRSVLFCHTSASSTGLYVVRMTEWDNPCIAARQLVLYTRLHRYRSSNCTLTLALSNI